LAAAVRLIRRLEPVDAVRGVLSLPLSGDRPQARVADSQHMSSRVVRLFALSGVVGSILVAGPAHAFPSGRAQTTSKSARGAQSALEVGVLSEVNGFRRRNGLSALRSSGRLAAAARQHTVEMAQRGYFSHTSADGSGFDRRIARFYGMGRSRYWSVGENLLWSSPSVDAAGALRMWLDSPPHRTILMTTRWREVGIAAVHVPSGPGEFGGREVTIVTADFGVRR
jgi:uncharacterized protein YkwD